MLRVSEREKNQPTYRTITLFESLNIGWALAAGCFVVQREPFSPQRVNIVGCNSIKVTSSSSSVCHCIVMTVNEAIQIIQKMLIQLSC